MNLRHKFASVAGVAREARTGALRHIFIRDGDRCWIVPVAEIVLFESEGNYTRVHFGGERPLVHRSLRAIERRLDPIDFFRANRAQIVNLRRIDRVDPEGDGRLRALLGPGRAVLMSRRASRSLRDAFSL